MRREGDAQVARARRCELLLDLGGVAVPWHAVRVDVLVGSDEVRLLAGRPTRSRHPRLRVDHYVVDQALTRERRQRKERGRRIAAGVGDEIGLADLLAIALGQPVHGLVEHLRGWMLAVPQLVHRGVP